MLHLVYTLKRSASCKPWLPPLFLSISLSFPWNVFVIFLPVSFATVWILVIAHRWLGLFKSPLLCLWYLLEMIHPEAQSDLGSLLWPGHCVGQWFCVLPLGSAEHVTLRCWDRPARLPHAWLVCPCLHLMSFAAIGDLRSHPRSHRRLQPCGALGLRGPSLSAGPSLQRETSPPTSGSPQGQFVRERQCSSLFLFIYHW